MLNSDEAVERALSMMEEGDTDIISKLPEKYRRLFKENRELFRKYINMLDLNVVLKLLKDHAPRLYEAIMSRENGTIWLNDVIKRIRDEILTDVVYVS